MKQDAVNDILQICLQTPQRKTPIGSLECGTKPLVPCRIVAQIGRIDPLRHAFFTRRTNKRVLVISASIALYPPKNLHTNTLEARLLSLGMRIQLDIYPGCIPNFLWIQDPRNSSSNSMGTHSTGRQVLEHTCPKRPSIHGTQHCNGLFCRVGISKYSMLVKKFTSLFNLNVSNKGAHNRFINPLGPRPSH